VDKNTLRGVDVENKCLIVPHNVRHDIKDSAEFIWAQVNIRGPRIAVQRRFLRGVSEWTKDGGSGSVRPTRQQSSLQLACLPPNDRLQKRHLAVFASSQSSGCPRWQTTQSPTRHLLNRNRQFWERRRMLQKEWLALFSLLPASGAKTEERVEPPSIDLTHDQSVVVEYMRIYRSPGS